MAAPSVLLNAFFDKYATTILSVLWIGIFISCAYAFGNSIKPLERCAIQPTLSTPKAAVLTFSAQAAAAFALGANFRL